MIGIIDKYPGLRCVKMMEVSDGKIVPETEEIFVEQIVKRNLLGCVFLDRKLVRLNDDPPLDDDFKPE